jgi:hypothetical protein
MPISNRPPPPRGPPGRYFRAAPAAARMRWRACCALQCNVLDGTLSASSAQRSSRITATCTRKAAPKPTISARTLSATSGGRCCCESASAKQAAIRSTAALASAASAGISSAVALASSFTNSDRKSLAAVIHRAGFGHACRRRAPPCFRDEKSTWHTLTMRPWVSKFAAIPGSSREGPVAPP